jgi:hypothetical protein
MPASPARYRDETDDYLAKVGVTRPINAQPEATTPLVATQYRPRKTKETRRSIVARVVLAVLGLVVAGASIVGLVTIIGTFGFFQYLLPIAFWPTVAACAMGLLVAFFAFATACTKLPCASAGTLVLAVCIAAFGVGGVAVSVGISNGHALEAVSTHWNSTVQSQAHEVCLFEAFFDCTGWITHCNETTPEINTTIAPPRTETAAPNTATPETTSWWPPSTDAPTEAHHTTPTPEHHTTPTPESPSGSNSYDHDAEGRFDSSSGSDYPPTPSPRTPFPKDKTTPSPWRPNPTPTETSTATTTQAADTTTPSSNHTETAHPTTGSPPRTPSPPPPPPTPPPVYACLSCPGQGTNPRECRGAVMAELRQTRAGTIAGLLGVAVVALVMIVCVAVSHLAVKSVALPSA